jgi:TetR/AcrR family transcriptional regulator, cholesterol catabolism regulator
VSSHGESNIARRRAAARTDGGSEYSERRQEIIRVAARVFKERGLRGTTLSHVAEAMGADRATLYYYVASKEDLFQEIVGEAVKLNLATATEIRDADISAPEKLRQLIEKLMLSYAEFYPVLYVLIQENLNHVPPEQAEWAKEMKRINRAYERVVIDIVQEGQNQGTLRNSAPPWLVAYGILGMVAWTNRWFNPNDSRATAQEIGTAFADTILDGTATRRSRRRRSSTPPG